MSAYDEHRRRLRRLRARRERLAAAREELTRAMVDAAELALEAGLSAPEIARELGVTHQRVYTMVGRESGSQQRGGR